MQAGIVPAQMLAAALTLAVRPGMTRKPRVIKRGHATLPAAKCLGECDNLKTNSFRVREIELVLAIVGETVSFIRHTVEAPCTEPVAFWITGGSLRTALRRRFVNLRQYQISSC